MFAKYFESELTFLRERAPEFAAGPYPAAARLFERGSDPDVERLLEGFAFLTARIRERLEDSVPELVEGLAELLLPHFLRPFPAATIVQFSTNIQGLRGPLKLAAGRPLDAPTRAGVACRFRTAFDVELLPIEVSAVELDRAHPGAPALTLVLRLTETGRALLTQTRELRFFLAGEPALTYALRLLLLGGRCKGVRARVLAGSGPVGQVLELGPAAIAPVGFGDDEALVPWPTLSHPGMRLVQELLLFPDKFRFFALRGPFLTDARGDRLELRFQFESPDPVPGEPSTSTFQLHCTPAVNLFEATADPIRVDPLISEHLLHPAGHQPAHAEVHTVRQVRGSRAGRADERVFHPFFAYAHAHDPAALFYNVRRARSPVDNGLDIYLSVHAQKGGPPVDLSGETLHVDLLCTGRALASAIVKDGSWREPRAGAVQVKRVTDVSVPVYPPLGQDLYWRLPAHLSLGQASLADAAALRSLLALYDFQAATSRSASAKIAAIRRVESALATRIIKGAPVRGSETLVELDESAFPIAGEAHLWLSVLDALFADSVGLNSFHELSARLHPSDARFRWPPRNGNLALI